MNLIVGIMLGILIATLITTLIVDDSFSLIDKLYRNYIYISLW